MKLRSVASILPATPIQMGKTEVRQALPTVKVNQVSPFLLLHHFGPFSAEPGTDPLDVGPHPHRGFEPVTFLYSGGIRHKDSRENEGMLQAGDVQWMTAGRGIIHSERASRDFLENGGEMEGIQLWINLPKRLKMVQPRYQDIKSAQFPQILEQDGRVQFRVVAGRFRETQGPAQTYTPLLILQLELSENGETTIEIPAEFNALVYLLDGESVLNNNFSYQGPTLLHFRNDGEGIALKANTKTRALVLAGEAIDEPLAQWGPFVMNDQTELLEAMRDYQAGKMGFYVD